MGDAARDAVERQQELETALMTGRDDDLVAMLEAMRAEDIADLLVDFSAEDCVRIFTALPVAQQAEVLDETDATTQQVLTRELSDDAFVAILALMPPDEATDLIENYADRDRERLLGSLPVASAGEIRQLLRYPADSAGGIMTSSYLATEVDRRANDVLEQLQSTIDIELVDDVYVVGAKHQLLGVVSLRDLLAAGEEPVEAVMQSEVISAFVDDDQEEVANLARKYNLKSVPIVGHGDLLLGVATIDDIVDVISDEADEDIYRLAGTEGGHPTQQRMFKRALARMPWLLLPGMSGFVVAAFMGTDTTAQRAVQLWSFLPLVMGVSGAVGTQASTILVRGIATGEIDTGRVLRVWGQELMIGTMVALTLATLVATLIWGSAYAGVHRAATLPAAVACGLFSGILIATVSGTALPFLCRAIGLDPALVAGPFITSLNDVLAASSFLAIGHAVMG